MAQPVVAEVILRKADGTSAIDAQEAITARNISEYRVDEEVAEEASQKLQDRGFEVLQVGPTSLTISGDQGLFEDTFGTALETKSTNVMPSDIEGAGTAYFEAKEPISSEPNPKESGSGEQSCKEPTSVMPNSNGPTSPKPTSKKPTSKEPTSMKPILEELASEEPTSKKPT